LHEPILSWGEGYVEIHARKEGKGGIWNKIIPMIHNLNIQTLIFDGYGTLFDLESAAPAFEQIAPGRGLEVLRWWRTKQLQYTRRCILTRHYRNLWVLMQQAMDDVCLHFHLDVSMPQRVELCEQYYTLNVFDEVSDVLSKLKEKYKLVILSHGTQLMLDKVVEHNQITPLFDAILSVDATQAYKPELKAYELVTQNMKLPENAFGYIGVNPMDIAGARAFGMKTIWIRRSMPENKLMNLIAHRSYADLTEMATEHYSLG
jgi:2-haloacid dehalogenase